LAPLLDLDDASRDDMIKRLYGVSHRSEWLAVILGASFWIALSQPWSWVGDWLDVYGLAIQITMFGLLGWLINGGLSNTRQLTKLNRHVKLDINNPGLMAPVAQWNLGISFCFRRGHHHLGGLPAHGEPGGMADDSHLCRAPFRDHPDLLHLVVEHAWRDAQSQEE
jgi:hypothetical protein